MLRSSTIGLLVLAGALGAQEQLIDHSAAFGRWGLAIKGYWGHFPLYESRISA